MPEVEKFDVNGQEWIGIEVAFDTVKEDWNEYRLRGGGSVRLRTEVTKIMWATDEAGNKQYNSAGEPNLVVYSTRQIRPRR